MSLFVYRLSVHAQAVGPFLQRSFLFPPFLSSPSSDGAGCTLLLYARLRIAGRWCRGFALGEAAWVAAPTGASRAPAAAQQQRQQPLSAAAGALLLASAPTPALAGGMFDFGITLPFVAITFLTMMATLNALWFAPVGAEIDDRNAKLLKTLSEATDNLSKADEIQVAYTEQIREARENASSEVKAYREKVEATIAGKIAQASQERESKAKEVRAKLEQDIDAKKAAAEAEIEKRKTAFVKETLAGVSL